LRLLRSERERVLRRSCASRHKRSEPASSPKHHETLWPIADTLASRIAAIPRATTRGNSAGLGNTITQGGALFAPLGLAVAPNGDILTVNANDGNLVESTTAGTEFAPVNLDTTSETPLDPGAGTLFGLAIAPNGAGVFFVDDGSNTLNLLN